MKNIISHRTIFVRPFIKLKSKFIKRELQKISSQAEAQRGYPIAVFGNDWIGINISVDGVYEKEDINDFFQLLKSVDLDMSISTIVDIGANIGNHAIQFSRYFNKVVAFEPNPRVYELLESNTKRIKNVEIFNLGCGQGSAILKLKETVGNIGGSSVVLDVESKSSIDIKIVPLDEMRDVIGRIDVIKIDVEGMEIDVLRGSEKTISASNPVICLEQHRSEFIDKFRETECIDWLRQRQFKIFALEKFEKRSFIVRELIKFYQIFAVVKRERNIVEYKKLPRGSYSMIYAIHESFFNEL
jgi:FkbM family methyltransferase